MTNTRTKQTALDETLQALVREQAITLYPDLVKRADVPLCVALPAGIHPYNRNSGYFDSEGNAIVLYQDLGRVALAGRLDEIAPTIQHELAHWYQFRALGEKHAGSSTNVHRKKTWSRACEIASARLWAGVVFPPSFFSPFKSQRNEDGNVRKVQRPDALTDVELHHWPRSMPDAMARHGLTAEV